MSIDDTDDTGLTLCLLPSFPVRSHPFTTEHVYSPRCTHSLGQVLHARWPALSVLEPK